MALSNRTKLFHYGFNRKLIEAVVLVIKDEINLLRTEHSLPERTDQQIITALLNKRENLSDYED